MRKLSLMAILLLVTAGIMRAQVSYVPVTATVTDPNGHPYANAGYTITLVNSIGNQVSSATTPNGQIYNAKPTTGIMDPTGLLSVQLVPNNILVSPPNTQWSIAITFPADRQILTNYPPWQLNYTTVINASTDLSSQLSAIANAIEFINLRTGQNTLETPSAVSQIIAGANCTVTPSSGIGIVTVSCAGGVTSFNGRAGAVVPATADYTAAQVTHAADVTTTNYFLADQTLINPNPSTSAQTYQQSPNFILGGNYWNGSSSVPDSWLCYDDLSQVPVSIMRCNHSGTLSSAFESNTISAGIMNTGALALYRNGLSSNSLTLNAGSPVATSGANVPSAALYYQGSYWNGTTAANDSWKWQATFGTGTNPTTTMELSRGFGTSGAANVSMPYPLSISGLTVSSFTTPSDCLLVGASGQITEGACSGGGVNATQLQGVNISATAPTNGYVLGYNGTNWLPISPAAASGTVALTPGTGVNQTIAQASSTTLAVNDLNNTFLASQYQTGGGNNGIANAVALNSGAGENVVADAGYASTETIPGITGGGYGGQMYGAIPAWPTNTHVQDQRTGNLLDAYMETGSGTAGSSTVLKHAQYYFNTYQVTGNTLDFTGFLNQCNFEGTGQQINGFGGINLKSYFFCNIQNNVSTAQGQKLGNIYNMLANGVGDAINTTRFTEAGGGTNAYTDQGVNDINSQVEEAHSLTTGTITSIASTSMQVSVSSGAGKQGQGRYLGDVTAKVSGSYPSAYTTGDPSFPPSPTIWGINGPVPPMASFVGTSFTPSTMIMGCTTAFGGSCPNSSGTNPSGTLNSASGGYAPGTLTVNVVTVAPGLPTGYATTTSGFSPGDVVTVADQQYIEQALVTAVPTSTTITIAFNKPHFNGFTIAKGGYAGYGIEVTGATTTIGGVSYPQVWPVVGTLDSTHLLVWDHNSQQNWSRSLVAVNNNAACQTDTVTTFSNVGAVISMYDATASALFQNASNIVVNTANSTYNGTFSTTAISGNYGGLPNQPALSYTAGSTPSGTVPTTGTITFCNSGFNLYPMMETADVLNPSTHAVDGYFKATPGTSLSAFTVGDTVEQFHWPAEYVSEGSYNVYQELPLQPYTNFPVETLTVGDNYTGGYNQLAFVNNTVNTKYRGYGGALPPSGNALGFTGIYGDLMNITTAPDSFIIQTGCKSAPIGCNNAALSSIGIFGGHNSQSQIYDNEALGSVDVSGPFRINHGAFSMTMYAPSFGVFAFSHDQSSSLTPDATLEAAGLTLPSSLTGCATFSAGVLGATGVACGAGGGTYPAAGIAVSPGTSGPWGTSLTAPASALVGINDTQTLTNKTLDSVTPTTMSYLDATSSIQTQLNDKANAAPADVTISIASFAIPAGVCYGSSGSTTAATVTMTGLTTSMGIAPTHTVDASAINGWGAVGGLNLIVWPSAANTASYKVCNSTAAPITGGAITLRLVAK